jgi:hypothetical protein
VQEDRVPPPVGIHRNRSNLNDSKRLLGKAVPIAERIKAHDHWVGHLPRADVALIIRRRPACLQLG